MLCADGGCTGVGLWCMLANVHIVQQYRPQALQHGLSVIFACCVLHPQADFLPPGLGLPLTAHCCWLQKLTVTGRSRGN